MGRAAPELGTEQAPTEVPSPAPHHTAGGAEGQRRQGVLEDLQEDLQGRHSSESSTSTGGEARLGLDVRPEMGRSGPLRGLGVIFPEDWKEYLPRPRSAQPAGHGGLRM